jgi:hypothetical protein
MGPMDLFALSSKITIRISGMEGIPSVERVEEGPGVRRLPARLDEPVGARTA